MYQDHWDPYHKELCLNICHPEAGVRQRGQLCFGWKVPGSTCTGFVRTTLPTILTPKCLLRSQRGPGALREVGTGALPSCLYSYTFLHGLEETSKEALNALLCWVVRMVLGRLGRLWSLPSSVAPFPVPWADLQRLSSSSLLPKRSRKKKKEY